MTNKGPEWQAVFGPISTSELIKGTYYIFPGIHLMCKVTEITPETVFEITHLSHFELPASTIFSQRSPGS